tara:strand:+ start:748 stop:1530 length:783 start_codon:yes stop_codon:yes gene_type:complete
MSFAISGNESYTGVISVDSANIADIINVDVDMKGQTIVTNTVQYYHTDPILLQTVTIDDTVLGTDTAPLGQLEKYVGYSSQNMWGSTDPFPLMVAPYLPATIPADDAAAVADDTLLKIVENGSIIKVIVENIGLEVNGASPIDITGATQFNIGQTTPAGFAGTTDIFSAAPIEGINSAGGLVVQTGVNVLSTGGGVVDGAAGHFGTTGINIALNSPDDTLSVTGASSTTPILVSVTPNAAPTATDFRAGLRVTIWFVPTG